MQEKKYNGINYKMLFNELAKVSEKTYKEASKIMDRELCKDCRRMSQDRYKGMLEELKLKIGVC